MEADLLSGNIPTWREEESWLGRSLPVQIITNQLGLKALPKHALRIAICLAALQITYTIVAERLAKLCVPRSWNAFSQHDKADWKLRIVSLAQSLLVGPFSLYILIAQHLRWPSRTVIESYFEYYEMETQLLDIAVSYFIWHLFMMVLEYRKHGIQMVLHAIAGTGWLVAAYHPFSGTYVPWFMVYELTNIPHNIYKILHRLGLGTSRASVINAIIWIILFFVFRIVWGNYATFVFMRDITRLKNLGKFLATSDVRESAAASVLKSKGLEPSSVGYPALLFYWFCALTVGVLNIIWFYLIVKTTIQKSKRRK